LEDAITTFPTAGCQLLIGKTKTTSNQQQTANEKSERARLERERELSKRARNEIIGRGDPVWSPVLLKRPCVDAYNLKIEN